MVGQDGLYSIWRWHAAMICRQLPGRYHCATGSTLEGDVPDALM